MKVKEYHNLIIKKHPYAESLNEKLLKDAERLLELVPLKHGFTNVRGKRTIQIYEYSSNVRTLINWITEEYRYNCKTWSPDDKFIKKRIGCWFAQYGKGDDAWEHHHRPHTWSWVYFVNCPKGSSPLVFPTSGKRVNAEAGKVVIFDAQVLHKVPPNRCDNRIVLAGNVTSWTDSCGSAPINT